MPETNENSLAAQIIKELSRQSRRQGAQRVKLAEVVKVQTDHASQLKEHQEWRQAWDDWTRRSKREGWLMVTVLLLGMALAQPAVGGTVLLGVAAFFKAFSALKLGGS